MGRFLKWRGKPVGLERELRAMRPRPRPEYFDKALQRLEANGSRRRALRPALVAALIVPGVLVLAGISLAAAGKGGFVGAAVQALREVGPPGRGGEAPALQQYEGAEGCTPGFWKNHTGEWQGFSPSQTLGSVFTIPASFSSISGQTLLSALSFGGGPTDLDAAKLLLHHAVASLLNAAHSDIDYPLSPSAVIGATNTALASEDRDTMLAQKDEFDSLNNEDCPL